MPTWKTVADHLEGRYKYTRISDNTYKLTFGFGARSQLVFVSRGVSGGDMEWVQIQSPVGEPKARHLPEILRTANDKLFGAFVMLDDRLYFRHSFPARAFEAGEFDMILGAITLTADQIEEKFVGGDRF